MIEKIRRLIVIILFLSFFAGVFIIGRNAYLRDNEKNFFKRFKLYWEVALPSGSELLYAEEEPSFTGDGYRYYVVQLNTDVPGTELFLRMFSTYRDTDGEALFTKALDTLSVPGEYRLTLGYSYQTFYRENKEKMNQLLMLYAPGTERLYIVGCIT